MACAFLRRPLFAGEAFVPAGLLSYAAPWSEKVPEAERPLWNPLMYDSAGQFYPWRKYAAEELRAGRIPLWNPYSFCGTPFLANSQSAALYPPNWLHVLLGPARATGWLAGLHLVLAATFMWRLLRRLGCGQAAGALGGTIFAFSGWQIAWLHLPTFLATSCWIPLGVLLALRLAERPRARRIAGLGACLGMMLLAGHLQIAFYGLAATAFAGFAKSLRSPNGLRALPAFCGALILGAALAAPQLLPAIELSRQSHRVAPASEAGYQAYVGYAPPLESLATLLSPDAFGNPSDGANPYFGLSRVKTFFNYAEGAMFVGSVALLLAVAGLATQRSRSNLFFAGTALFALLVSFGSPLDRLLYFGVPGFSQSGSPGRALVLWAFAMAGLAALGFHRLLGDSPVQETEATEERPQPKPIKPVAFSLAILAACWAATLSTSSQRLAQREAIFGDLPVPGPNPAPHLALFALGALALLMMAARKLSDRRGAALVVSLAAVELLVAGGRFNPSAPEEQLYPETELTRRLREIAGHDRIAPVNRNWSFLGPKAVLPPNASLALRLHDAQGYDSLFAGRYKNLMNRLAAPDADASPPEVGNMVFVKTPFNPLLGSLGVRVLVSLSPLLLPGVQEEMIGSVYVSALPDAPGRAQAEAKDGATVEWIEDSSNHVVLRIRANSSARVRLADQAYPGWRADRKGKPVPIRIWEGAFREVEVPAGEQIISFRFEPSSFRAGLFLMGCALAFIAAAFSAGRGPSESLRG